MRFSSLFRTPKRPAVQAEDAARADLAPNEPTAVAPLPTDLPEDLDARVRALGEWQVSEL
jgi:hypothetical protein